LFDLVIRNGMVVDGSGNDRSRADVAVNGNKITEVGNLTAAEARINVDASNCIVAPGFIDVHNHSDGWLLRQPNFAAKTLQGFTTEVIMADGIGYAPVNEHTAREWLFYLRTLDGLRLQDYTGWETFEEFLTCYEGRAAQNVASHLPYANVRSLACGFRRIGVDDFQMREIQRQIRIGMEAGAVGVSTGLDYIVQCFATTDELVEALSVMAPYDGLYVTHVRYKKGLLPALEEAAEIGRRAGIRVHISHLKGQSPGEVDKVLEFLDRTRRDVDISFDVYPYQPGSTMLNYLLPYEVWEEGPIAAAAQLQRPEVRARFTAGLNAYRLPLDRIRIAWVNSKENAHLQGKTLSAFIDESELSAADALSDLLIEERFTPLLVFDEGDDRLVEPLLQHDLFMLGSDGIYCEDGLMHPRVYGSAGRVIGPLCRDRKLFTLEQAVNRMTSFPANRFRLENRGLIKCGYFADIVVFDPDTVTDQATYDHPHRPTVGVTDVIVNGTPVVEGGKVLTATHGSGQVLRAAQK
jgi:N-acyl-D-amino-acid deacylase